MKLKQLLILVLVLAILLVLNFIKKLDSIAKRSEADLLAIVKIELVEKDLQPAFVDRIEIRKGTDALTLAKSAEGIWRIESRYGARAGSVQAENLIRKVSEANGEQRTDVAAVLADFELTDDQAYAIAVSSKGTELARVYVSPVRVSPTENFVRAAGSNQVLVTETDLLSVLGIYGEGSPLDYKVFADLRVVPAEIGMVTRISVTPPGGSAFVLVKKEGSNPAEWRFGSDTGPEADTEKVNGLLSDITSLFASDALDPAGTDYGFNEKKSWIDLTESKDGKTAEYRLVDGSCSEGSCYLKSLPEGLVFRGRETAVDGLRKRDKASFAKPASS